MKRIVRAARTAVLGFVWAFAMTGSYAAGLDVAHRNATDVGVADAHRRDAPMPHKPSRLPPTQIERIYHLPPTDRLRPELIPPELRKAMHTGELTQSEAACSDMTALASHQADDLADYLVGLPNAECLTPLFAVSPSLAGAIFSPANLLALAQRFALVSVSYASKGAALANVSVFFRAAYSLANEGRIDAIGADVLAWLRPSIVALVAGDMLFAPNKDAPTTAGTVVMLITDMHDEENYLDLMKGWVTRFTDTPRHPDAALALDDPTVP